MTIISSQDLDRDVNAAKRAADAAPVVITDQGEPAYVLLSINSYRELQPDGQALVDRLSMDDDIDFEPEPLSLGLRVPQL